MGQQHNELHGAGTIQRAVVEAVGGAGHELGLERLGETLQPIIDIWSRPEWSILRQEHLGLGETEVAAGGAGNRSIVSVRNTSVESDPWVVIVLDGSFGGTNANQVRGAISFLAATTDLANVTIREGRSRIGVPFTRIQTQNNAALPAGISAGQFVRSNINSVIATLAHPVVLRFGQSLHFYPDTDNVAIAGVFYTVTRRLLSGERSGAT